MSTWTDLRSKSMRWRTKLRSSYRAKLGHTGLLNVLTARLKVKKTALRILFRSSSLRLSSTRLLQIRKNSTASGLPSAVAVSKAISLCRWISLAHFCCAARAALVNFSFSPWFFVFKNSSLAAFLSLGRFVFYWTGIGSSSVSLAPSSFFFPASALVSLEHFSDTASKFCFSAENIWWDRSTSQASLNLNCFSTSYFGEFILLPLNSAVAIRIWSFWL